VTMPAEHRVDPPRNPRANGLLVRLELRRRECRQRCARQIGIDEQRRRRGFNHIARGSEPPQASRSRRWRAERAKVVARLKPRKQGAIKPAHARRVYRSAHGCREIVRFVSRELQSSVTRCPYERYTTETRSII